MTFERVIAIASLLCLLPFPSWCQPSDTLFALARDSGKPVLLIFSGSDWCIPCRQLRKDVLDQAVFQEFAENQLHLLVADFPQRTKQSREEILDNESLARRFNPGGQFPKLILLDPGEELLTRIDTRNQSPESLIQQIRPFIKEQAAQKVYSLTTRLMGSTFEFRLVAGADQEAKANNWLQKGVAEVRRIEALISSWDSRSQTADINANAGIRPVEVDPEVIRLLERCQQLSRLTQGAFDVSYAALDQLWQFDGTQNSLPDPDSLSARLKLIGFDNIQLNPGDRTVFLPVKGMKIGFGAIGKGYAADQVMAIWEEAGFQNGLVNAGGDLLARGVRADGTPWQVGIADPRQPDEVMGWLEARNQSIATSGDYERFILIQGERYSHIIDPRTGFPAKGIKSTTVVAPSAELADALASAVFVLGTEIGLDLINQLPDTEALIIDDSDRLHTSNQIDLQNLYPDNHE